MCATHTPLKKQKITTAHLYFVSILLAFLSCYFHILPLIELAKILTDNFIKIFKCISLPIISLSIIVTFSKFRGDSHIKAISKKTLYYTIGTTLVAGAVTCGLYYFISPTNLGLDNPIAPLNSDLQTINYLAYLNNIIPSNIFAPFIEHQVMGVLLISIIVGLALSFINEDPSRNAITQFFKGLHALFMVITSWVVKIIPLALFGFITTTILQIQSGGEISGLSEYLLVVILANIVQGFIILPLFLYTHKIKPYSSMKAMFPALSVAFFSKSSAGTLPITINTIEKNLGVSPKVSRLVLPLCTSINMNGCAAFIFATVIYLMQNHGIEISFITMLSWIVIATIAAIGNAGVPMGCFFLSASLLSSMNVPIEILGLILPFYSIIDMVETALNVWSDSCVTKVIDGKFKEKSSLD